jgi:iron(II)-dependent oxidoreductase
VTNRQYRAFVDAGGYAESALWSPDIWPSVPDFVDRSGRPGPRFWVHGAPAPGEDDHPVAGVSWFEAEAYARWVGKRLPTGSEWVKAASWPVTVGNELAGQRKFPWGNAMDRRRANLWGSGPGHTLPVTALPEGASVGNIAQLCGNVWEWTADDFGVGRRPQDRIQSTIPWKAIRGGAFDTYFDNHVSNDFQSGEHPLSRKANIGFRCALSRCDVAGDEPVAGPLEVTGEVPVDVAGEVPVEELVDATFEERAAEPVSEPVEEELAVVACGEDRP